MKASSLVAVLYTVSTAMAAAVHLPARSSIDIFESGGVSAATPLLEHRSSCELFDLVISAIGTSSALVIYTTTGGVLARVICTELNGSDEVCNRRSAAIAAAIAAIFTASEQYYGSKATKRSNETISLAEYLAKAFTDNGEPFESINTLAPSGATKRDSKSIIDQASVKGLEINGTTIDAIIADFGDGDGHLYLTEPPANTTSNTKRHDGAGFKLSYTTRISSLLTRAHQIQMSQDIATSWAYYAGQYDISEWIGFQETGHAANFYLRIIPEDDGYGEEYESVDAPCGGMAAYL